MINQTTNISLKQIFRNIRFISSNTEFSNFNNESKSRFNQIEQVLNESNELKFNTPQLESLKFHHSQLNNQNNNKENNNNENELENMINNHTVDDEIIKSKQIQQLIGLDDLTSSIKIIDDIVQLGREELLKTIDLNWDDLWNKVQSNNDHELTSLFIQNQFQIFQDDQEKIKIILFKIYLYQLNLDFQFEDKKYNFITQENIWFLKKQSQLQDLDLHQREIKNQQKILQIYTDEYQLLNKHYQQVQPYFKLTAALSRIGINRRVGIFHMDIPLQIQTELGPIVCVRNWHKNNDNTLRGSIKKHLKMIELSFPNQFLVNWESFNELNNEERKIYLFSLLKQDQKGMNQNYIQGLKYIHNLDDQTQQELSKYLKDNSIERKWNEKKSNQEQTRADIFKNEEFQDIIESGLSEYKLQQYKQNIKKENEIWKNF